MSHTLGDILLLESLELMEFSWKEDGIETLHWQIQTHRVFPHSQTIRRNELLLQTEAYQSSHLMEIPGSFLIHSQIRFDMSDMSYLLDMLDMLDNVRQC